MSLVARAALWGFLTFTVAYFIAHWLVSVGVACP